ncbi:quinone-dependent dihydroorotate dehydrogenase [Thiobacter aerophilum]|uniref:Dihydroorotate dehydrogenase (quinone) n=1 Tax=Thiobacter aerophilum TaxID=3121275 RepID=A0ABV0EFC8_9BURK
MATTFIPDARMFYCLARPLLFALDPETAHELTIQGLSRADGLLSWVMPQRPCAARRVMGIEFPNPLGLAAGLDKNGEAIAGLAALGFGFIEIGTVTPRPQAGNPRPRLFRIPEAQAIINRMGFNNQGVDALIENVKHARFRGVLGINIGKNFDTPMERAADDYLLCLRKVYAHASYVTVNVSSPNTRNLRELQESEALDALLIRLKTEQARLADEHGRYVPLVIKIAPDLTPEQLVAIADRLLAHRIDGVIATNTTVSREGVSHLPHGQESGGLSGAPLREKSTAVIRALYAQLQDAVPIIGVGGIMNGADALEKIEAGASLVQVYTGLVYRGPDLIREVLKTLCAPPPNRRRDDPFLS